MAIISTQPNTSTLIPPKLVFECDEFIVHVVWGKDPVKINVHYIKKTCTNCRIRFRPFKHEDKCPICRINYVGSQQHLEDVKLVNNMRKSVCFSAHRGRKSPYKRKTRNYHPYGVKR